MDTWNKSNVLEKHSIWRVRCHRGRSLGKMQHGFTSRSATRGLATRTKHQCTQEERSRGQLECVSGVCGLCGVTVRHSGSQVQQRFWSELRAQDRKQIPTSGLVVHANKHKEQRLRTGGSLILNAELVAPAGKSVSCTPHPLEVRSMAHRGRAWSFFFIL